MSKKSVVLSAVFAQIISSLILSKRPFLKRLCSFASTLLVSQRLILFEEGEVKDYYTEDEFQRIDREKFKLRWERFTKGYTYPLYGVILATPSAIVVRKVIEEHRDEIAEMSGKRCCFIYFRKLSEAKLLMPFEFKEHSKWTYRLAELLQVDLADLPCILFFNNIDSGDYVIVNLADLSEDEILPFLRELFTHSNNANDSRLLKSIKRFKLIKRFAATRDQIIGATWSLGREIFVDVITAKLTENRQP